MSGPAPESGTPRVVLHVGLHKTGTTYLQNLLRRNRARLARDAGVYVPSGPRKTFFASLDLIPWDRAVARDPRVPGAWDRLAAEVSACGLPTAVVSEERLDVASTRQARRAVESFPGSDVHVVVTVRDLARVVVSHWQDDVKNGGCWTLDEYVGRLQDPGAAATAPARGFWLHEDVTAVLRTWSKAVPAPNVHVVTVPPAGSAPGLLTQRLGAVVGFTEDDVPRPPAWNNENAGTVGTELVRRLNARVDGRVERSAYKRGVTAPVTRRLATLPGRGTPSLDPGQLEWAAATSARFADEIRAAGYHVVGDLADLQPDHRGAGQAVADVCADAPVPADGALLDAAMEALAELAERHTAAVTEAERAAAAAASDGVGPLPRMRNELRSRAFAATRGLADLAGRSSAGRYVGAAYLRRRAGR